MQGKMGREIDQGPDNMPGDQRTTVILPILKQYWETATALTVYPSGTFIALRLNEDLDPGVTAPDMSLELIAPAMVEPSTGGALSADADTAEVSGEVISTLRGTGSFEVSDAKVDVDSELAYDPGIPFISAFAATSPPFLSLAPFNSSAPPSFPVPCVLAMDVLCFFVANAATRYTHFCSSQPPKWRNIS
jgi:hypothetical protein